MGTCLEKKEKELPQEVLGDFQHLNPLFASFSWRSPADTFERGDYFGYVSACDRFETVQTMQGTDLGIHEAK